MSQGDGTASIEGFFEAPDGGRPARKRGRGWIIAAWIVGGLIILLGIAAVLVDNGLRSAAESVAADQIEQRLPDNVTGAVDVHIGGGSVILQYLSGSFDHVELDAPTLAVNGIPAPAHVVASGVSTDLSTPVRDVTATVKMSQDALNALLKVPQATSGVTLGDGTLSFDGAQSLLGFTVKYHATAKPKAAGTTIELTPTAAKVTAGPAGLDLSDFVTKLLGAKPLPVCVAQYLPKGVDVTKIDVNPKAATVTFHAADLALTSQTFSTKGSCG
jgi:hypothetical protein